MNLSGRGLYIVTGANTGIGRVIAAELASRQARVLLACRSLQKAEPVAAELRRSSGNEHVACAQLDLVRARRRRRQWTTGGADSLLTHSLFASRLSRPFAPLQSRSATSLSPACSTTRVAVRPTLARSSQPETAVLRQ
jgi:NAD(P)-dependent dehydrogenase (short-subunit alcohol dehydrogenase family)